MTVKSNSDVVVLDQIPFKPDFNQVMQRLHMHGDNKRFEKSIQELIDIVIPLARPKAVYKVSPVGKINGDSVNIDGIIFNSRLLRVNLVNVERVFPFVATCGREVDSQELASGDGIKQYCLDLIKTMMAVAAASYVKDHLLKHYNLNEVSTMNPGEIKLWPITQQKELFSVLGDVEGMIGVKLTESCGMIPVKSRSGIYFPAETKFENCALCLQKRCPGRRVPYSPEAMKRYE